jgi:hypothetical protein
MDGRIISWRAAGATLGAILNSLAPDLLSGRVGGAFLPPVYSSLEGIKVNPGVSFARVREVPARQEVAARRRADQAALRVQAIFGARKEIVIGEGVRALGGIYLRDLSDQVADAVCLR